MKALEIRATKDIMNALLASDRFDRFLVEEAMITTYNTFHIDGHLVKGFFTDDELGQFKEDQRSLDFSYWKDIRPFCFQLIKGKKTPVSFKVVLHAAPELVSQIAADPDCQVAADLIRSLALNIRYDNGKVACITGCAFTTFLMDKSVEKLWDPYVCQFLSGLGLDFEEI